MVGTLLALVLLAAAPEATPTPFPPQEEAPPLPARAPPVPGLPEMAIVPSLGLGGFTGEDGHDRRINGIHFWGGVLIHPAPSDLGPFMGVGASFDLVSNREGREAETWYGTAEMRYGVAWLLSPRKYEGALFPGLAVYAIGGWRPERESSGLWRAGLGVSSPALLVVGVVQVCAPIPSTVEVVVDAPDAEFSGDDSRVTVRGGWQF